MPRFSFIMFSWLLLLTSCIGPHEAQKVLAEADSLYYQGKLYRDTVLLNISIKEYNRFFNCSEEKARLLYYLGRNYSYEKLENKAVDYYIAAAKLNTSDNKLRGRLYSNMAYICAQQYKDSLALIFYNKGSDIWDELVDKEYYIANLLDISMSLCKMNKIIESDSVWQIAYRYANNEYLRSRAFGIRAYYYNIICKYDSAIYCLNNITIPEVFNIAFCDAQHAIAMFYTDRVDSAVYYANKVIANRSSTRNQLIAYTVLREKAYRDNDISAAMKRDDMVEELQKTIDSENEQRTLAISKLEQYLHEKEDYNWLWILLSVFFVVVSLILLFLYFLKNKKRVKALSEKTEILRTKEAAIMSFISNQQKTTKDNIQNLRGCNEWKELLCWSHDSQSATKIDIFFNNFATRLQTNYNLNIVEIKYCTLLLLDFDSRYISEQLPYSYSGIKTLKKRIANKLFILPQDMSVFLANFALQSE